MGSQGSAQLTAPSAGVCPQTLKAWKPAPLLPVGSHKRVHTQSQAETDRMAGAQRGPLVQWAVTVPQRPILVTQAGPGVRGSVPAALEPQGSGRGSATCPGSRLSGSQYRLLAARLPNNPAGQWFSQGDGSDTQ